MHESYRPTVNNIMDAGCPSNDFWAARRFRAVKDVLFSQINNEAVILSLRNGKYYGLNEVGLTIWNAVQRSCPLAEIESILIDEYEVDTETCRLKIEGFLSDLLAEGLIEAADA